MTTMTNASLPEFRPIPLKDLLESKTNPRHYGDKQKLVELTESVRRHGVLQPILVRPHDDRFEIVAGSRRYLAAKAAGLAEIPARVRSLTDAEVLEVQIIENLQREDIHPLDEAEGYKQLMEKAKYDVAGIAAKVGKSASYVYQRLKLAELLPELKKAFFEDKLTAGHAILLARLQVNEQRAVVKGLLRFDQSYTSGRTERVVSVRDLANWIQENIHLDLSKAAWDLADEELVKRAGACTTCPKRTGANPQLFPDVKKKDTCTDPGCFQLKLDRHLVQVETKLRADKQTVARISGQQLYGSRPKQAGILYAEDWRAAQEKCSAQVIGLVVESGNHWDDAKRLRVGSALPICADKKCKVHWHAYESSGARGGRSDEEKARERRRRQEMALRGRVFSLLASAKSLSLTDEHFRLIVHRLHQELGIDAERQLLKAIPSLPASKHQYGLARIPRSHFEKQSSAELRKWAVLLAIVTELYVGSYSTVSSTGPLYELAKLHQVNVKKLARAVQAEFAKKKKKAKKTSAAKKEATK